MPVYEFACNACGARVSIFTRSFSAEVEENCERCGSKDLRRVVSRVAMLGIRGTPQEINLDTLNPNDPRAMGAWARQMQAELGDDAGPEMEELAQRLERGESLDDEFDAHDAHDHNGDE